jgi:NADPH2:quinone reductase
MKAIRIHAHGGPEVLQLDDVSAPVPKPGEVLVRVKAAGVNFIDIYQRKGIYPLALPYTPGSEGVGLVATAGGGFADGDRVLWVNQSGSCAEELAVATDRLVKVPAALSDADAVAAGLQALTAQFLCESTYAVKAGDDVLIHAGAGGVGLLLIQMAKLKGARVFTTVSTAAKAKLARGAGADEVILYTESDFVAAVKDKTGGKGVHVVYDSVGQATALGSLSVVRPLGMLVLFGQSSGVVPPIDPLLLMRQGSIFLTRPTLFHHIADGTALQQRAARVFSWVESGAVKLHVGAEYPLAEAGRAQADLEARRTTGKLVLRVAS